MGLSAAWYVFIMLLFKRIISFNALSDVYPSMKCKPVEEGKPGLIQIEMIVPENETDFTLFLSNRGQTIVFCYSKPECYDGYKSGYNVSSVLLSNVLSIRVDIHRATYSDEGMWTLNAVDLRTLETYWIVTFNLTIYVKSTEVLCTASVRIDGYHIECTSDKVYPYAKCQFITNHNGTKTVHSPDEVYYVHNLLYRNINIQYTSTCKLLLANSEISEGRYDIDVQLYPSVSDSDNDIALSTNGCVSFKVDKPIVALKKCDNITAEGFNLTCTCVVTAGNRPATTIQWQSDSNSTRKLYIGQTLHWKAKRESGFFCQGINQFGLHSAPVYYKPTVITISKNISCNMELTEENVAIDCTIYKVFPKATCFIQFKFKDTYVNYTGDVTYYHTVLPIEPVYYATRCKLVSPISDFQPGDYSVQITAYPELNGIKKNMVHTKENVLYFLLGKSKTENPRDPTVPIENYDPFLMTVASVLTVLVLIGVIACCVLVCKKKGQSNPPTLLNSTSTTAFASSAELLATDENHYVPDSTAATVYTNTPTTRTNQGEHHQHQQPGIQHKVYIGPIDVNVSVDNTKVQNGDTDSPADQQCCIANIRESACFDVSALENVVEDSEGSDYISPLEYSTSVRSSKIDNNIYDTPESCSSYA